MMKNLSIKKKTNNSEKIKTLTNKIWEVKFLQRKQKQFELCLFKSQELEFRCDKRIYILLRGSGKRVA